MQIASFGVVNPWDEPKNDPDNAGVMLTGWTASPPTWHVRCRFLE